MVDDERAGFQNDPDDAAAVDLLDNAQAYIPGDRRRALAAGRRMQERVSGAALFADISGFTPLTEALANELGAHRGAEELTLHLNRLFHALIAQLERYGGDVIYFSGDSITCWIDGDDALRATACALAMQATMERLGDVVTPAGARVRLAMKAAVAVGTARRFEVGDPEIQRLDVLAGRLVDDLVAAERQAARGEVVLEPSALAALGERVALRTLRRDADSGRAYGVVDALTVPVADAPAPKHDDTLPEAIVKQWLLPAVHERLLTGRGEFLAELRPAYPLFMHFGGIDYDADEGAAAKLDFLIRQVQRIVTAYGGNLLHLTLGDKGAYLYAVFGSPLAHEDDATRAASAALELRALPATTAATDVHIAVTYGRLRSGTYGHKRRQTFTCLGDAVNLAARLMAKAPPGEIYVSEPVRRAAGDFFAWQPLAPMLVKGKSEPVSAVALVGSTRAASRADAGREVTMIGRRAELATLVAALDEAVAGHGQIVGIAAEAGMGKSRLVAELARTARARGLVVASGECQAYGTNKGYFVWREICATLLRVDRSRPEAEQVAALQARLAAIDPALVPRAPLLQGVLDLPIPDNELTAQFDAKLRKSSLEGLLVECLAAFASDEPVVIVLEDCHWIGPLSRDLVEVLGRTVSALRVLLVLAYRSGTEQEDALGVEGLGNFREIELAELDADQSVAMIRAKLATALGADTLASAALVELVTRRAQGNPFYIEELLSFIRSQGVDLRDEAALQRLQLPESLHSLILSRIDALGESPRRTLKVASIVGRVFPGPMLPELYPELGGLDNVTRQLETLRTLDLVDMDQAGEQTYLFRHVVTHEVAYESMPFAFRSMLHERAGGLIEAADADAIERNLDVLAHHYWHGLNLGKKREYLGRAARAAEASYANSAAIGYLERLVPLLDGPGRVDVLLKLGKVLELVGDWQRAEKVDGEALALAETLGDDAWRAAGETALAEVARKQGRFDEAVGRLDRAAAGYTRVGDEPGVGRVLHLAGTIAAQRGDYDRAVENYAASLAIREGAGDKGGMASLLSNLGIVAEYRGDYDGSRGFHERALALRTEINDRRGIGNSTNNLGMISVLQKEYADARDWFRRSMLLNREVGDAWMVALCHHNLGNATRGLGEYEAACEHYAESLRAFQSYADRYALAFLLEDIGVLAALTRDSLVALEMMGAADALRDAIGSPRAPSLEVEIGAALKAAVAPLSAVERQAARERGRTLGPEASCAAAHGFCARSRRAGTVQ